MNKKRKHKEIVDCNQCKTQSDCCQLGAWIDLEEAKKIVSLGIKGDFFHLEKDDEFPSGFRVGTSYEDNLCSFLDSDGLCRVHKVDYKFKPNTCKDFPYEKKKLSSFVDIVCTEFITKKGLARLKKRKKRRSG